MSYPTINEATKFLQDHETATVYMLQRKFLLGYAAAARLMQELEQAGVVTPYDGQYSRRVIKHDENP